MASRDPDKRRVVGLSGTVLDPRVYGGRIDGIGVYTRALQRTLPGCGFDVELVLAPVVHGRRYLAPPPEALAFRAPLAACVAASRLSRVRVLPGAAAVESAIDVYHATDYQVPPLRHTPVVATIHDTIPLSHPEWASARLRGVKNWILRSGVPRADLVVAISRATVPDIVAQYGVPEHRIRVVPAGVDGRWCEPRDPEGIRRTLAALGLAPGYFLFVGTLQPRKNLDALLDAYDRLPAAVRRERALVVVGRVGWGVDALEARLRAREEDGRSKWLRYVDEPVLLDLYAGAGVFVLPSLAEGFGLPLLEAMASGLPVIATDIPVFREVAGAFATYFDGARPDALTEAMLEGAAQPDAPASAEARRAHARRFDWSVVAAQLAEVYRELV